MECVTPSNSVPLSLGESADIYQILSKLKSEYGENLDTILGEELESMKKCIKNPDVVNYDDYIRGKKSYFNDLMYNPRKLYMSSWNHETWLKKQAFIQ
jgi:hypothetical protein